MSDDRQASGSPRSSSTQRGNDPAPVLKTRPATMLTAIGLCVFIMIMQLLPEFRDGGMPRFSPTQPASIVSR